MQMQNFRSNNICVKLNPVSNVIFKKPIDTNNCQLVSSERIASIALVLYYFVCACGMLACKLNLPVVFCFNLFGEINLFMFIIKTNYQHIHWYNTFTGNTT